MLSELHNLTEAVIQSAATFIYSLEKDQIIFKGAYPLI